MILEAIIIGIAIVLSSALKVLLSKQNRKAFANASVVGPTSGDGEAVQITATLYEDEGKVGWEDKLKKLWDLREGRIVFNNQLFQKLQAKQEALAAEAKEKGVLRPV